MILSFLEVKGDIDFKLIDIIREFMEVFPEEVPGLPPQREIKFTINMVLGVGPVSITPNKIAPLELVELNKQIKDLLEKEMIIPSVSSWGTLMLLVKKKDDGLRLCVDY